MECPHCQTPLKEGYKFCSHCGAAVTPPSPEAPSPESPAPAEAAPAATAPLVNTAELRRQQVEEVISHWGQGESSAGPAPKREQAPIVEAQAQPPVPSKPSPPPPVSAPQKRKLAAPPKFDPQVEQVGSSRSGTLLAFGCGCLVGMPLGVFLLVIVFQIFVA